MNNPRRLSTNIANRSEHDRLQAQARSYTRTRQAMITDEADKAGKRVSIREADRLYDICNGVSQGNLESFRQAVIRELQTFVHNPADSYSVLDDWMDETMNDQERAKREVASWYENPKICYFDTETTGLDAPNVPWSVGACERDGISLCDIRLKTLDEKGNSIKITPEASRVTGMDQETIDEFFPLEDNQGSIISLEGLMESGSILAGYNTSFDRGMICRALTNARERVHSWKCPKEYDNVQVVRWAEERGSLSDRLETLRLYFSDGSHWLETKDVFVRAIGLDPNSTPGRKTRLQDIARATRALVEGESQQHGALSDTQLLAQIVRNIRKEVEEMADKKSTTTTTPKPAPKAKGPFPPVANPADKEPEPTTPVISQETQDYIKTLEKSLEECQTQVNEYENSLADAQQMVDRLGRELEAERENRVKLGDRIRELENLCEEYQQNTVQHREAKTICFTDIIVNKYPVNFTVREGYTPEQAVEDVFKHLKGMQMLKDDPRVKTFMVGKPGRSDFYELKAVQEKPADEQPPAHEKPATPKGNGNGAPAPNKPATPAKPNQPPAPNQPANPPPQNNGKVEGEKASQQYNTLCRNEINGQSAYELGFLLKNGKQAEKAIPVAKRDTAALETALREYGWEPAEIFSAGETYPVNILAEWEWGGLVDTKKPDGPRWHNKATFKVMVEQPV